VIKVFGKSRLVDDLVSEDFEALRETLARRLGVHGLSREVQQVRTLFKYAYETGLIERTMRFGPTFKRPTKKNIRLHRQKSIHEHGKRMFEASELRAIIEAAPQPLKSMVLLGINCGFGNTDCSTLPKSAVNLKNAQIDFPRPKTAIERRCPLWPETIRSIRAAFTHRPKAQERFHDGLAFITTEGQPWIKDSFDKITKEFRKLLDELDLHRPGLGFYAIRHTFETIAGTTRDQVAVDLIMGHADDSMAERYREQIYDERLLTWMATSKHRGSKRAPTWRKMGFGNRRSRKLASSCDDASRIAITMSWRWTGSSSCVNPTRTRSIETGISIWCIALVMTRPTCRFEAPHRYPLDRNGQHVIAGGDSFISAQNVVSGRKPHR